MADWFSNLILAKSNGDIWEKLGPVILVVVFVALKFLGNIFKTIKEKAEKTSSNQPKPVRMPQKRRYAPLDHQGRPIKEAGREEIEILPDNSSSYQSSVPIEQPMPVRTEPIAPANAKILPEHDHAKEFAAIKRYKERIAKQKTLAAQKQRLAQQIKQRTTKKQKRRKTIKTQEPEIISVVETIEPPTEFSIYSIKNNKENLRTAIILNEILSKPISLRN